MFKRLFIFTLLSSNIVTSFAGSYNLNDLRTQPIKIVKYNQFSSILEPIFNGAQSLMGGDFFFFASDLSALFDVLSPESIDLNEISAKLDEINSKIDDLSSYAHQIGQSQYMNQLNTG
jgi:TolA-binding protein